GLSLVWRRAFFWRAAVAGWPWRTPARTSVVFVGGSARPEGAELIRERQHHIPPERLRLRRLDVGVGHVLPHRGVLVEQVVDAQAHLGEVAGHEFVAESGVPRRCRRRYIGVEAGEG